MSLQLPGPGERVVVAMSGGVDSSVAAALLHERGCEVIGVTLSLYEDPDGAESGCCTPEDVTDARRVCADLGVRHFVLNYKDAFERAVVKPFVDFYKRGLTPNPCAQCNNVLKFDRLLRRTRELEARWLATGHYARILRGGDGTLQLARARDEAKDQSYFLYGVRRSALPFITFPLGDHRKEEARDDARRLGVRTSEKPDSQDVCFIPDGRTADFVRKHGGAAEPGPIVDDTGRQLGSHDGLHAFTVGQRRGVGVASSHPLYVLRLEPESHTLVVGSPDKLDADVVHAQGWNWLRAPNSGEELAVKVRYRSPPAPVAHLEGDGDDVRLTLTTPVRAVAPGQAVVLYGGQSMDEVLGGGTIGPARAG